MSMPGSKAANEKYCADCGSIINARAEICPKCGVRQLPAPSIIGVSTPSGKNKIAAAMIPALVGFVEGIIYRTMSDQAFEAKYG